MSLKKAFFLCALFLSDPLHAQEGSDTKKASKQVRIGNLALPSSQQPGTLWGFGQNVVDKHDTFAFLFPTFLLGHHKSFAEVAPVFLYGIQDNLSLFIGLPIAARLKLDGHKTSGCEDLIAQLEYAFYLHEAEKATNQMTLVGSLFLPCGNDRREPATGFGSPSFFAGLTASHLSSEWYWYLSSGALLTTRHNCNTKAGNQGFYQAGFGKNIAYRTDQWIVTWMLELSGMYTQKRKIEGVTDQNSGGNMVLLGPSLWFSTEQFILQGGIAPVLREHLFGRQLKDSVNLSLNMGWKFN